MSNVPDNLRRWLRRRIREVDANEQLHNIVSTTIVRDVYTEILNQLTASIKREKAERPRTVVKLTWEATNFSNAYQPPDAKKEITLTAVYDARNRSQIARVIRRGHRSYEWFTLRADGGRGEAKSQRIAQNAVMRAIRDNALIIATACEKEVGRG
jgi:hypothetical protein